MKKIFLMLVAAFMVGAATMNAQVKGGEFILRGGRLIISKGTIPQGWTCCRATILAWIITRTFIKVLIGMWA